MTIRPLLTVLATLAAVVLAPAYAGAATIEVEPGPTSLGDAILLAEPGDTIVLSAGRYVLTEGDVLEAKDLTLRGAGRDETTVIPSGGGEAFEDPGVTVEGINVGEPQQPAAEDESEGDDQDDDGIETKAQIVALIATIAIFLLVLELVRRRRLVERYALLWMSAAIALLVLAVWTDGLNVLASLMGIQEPANAIFILAFAVGFLVLLNFSVASSRLSEESKILAQEVARLDQELRAERALRAAAEASASAEDPQDDPPVAAK